MQLITFFGPETIPLVATRPTKRKPADLIAEIHAKMAATTDVNEHARLLDLGINILRRRERGRARRRSRA